MRERIRQMMAAWRQLKQIDPRALPLVLVGMAVGLLIGVGAGMLIGLIWLMAVFGFLGAFTGALFVFSRRVQKAQYLAIEGQPGAAAAVLQTLRGQWFVTPAVAYSAKQDLVHRVVGRPGIILVGEGSPQRTKSLLAKEKKRLTKVAGDAPVRTVLVGDGDGQVPIRKLQVHVTKMSREVGKKDVPKLERRLKPLDKSLPIPKGIDPNQANRPRPKPR
ncbi:DUF4191 domain-containing protein [Nitriliruptor alkaliphilus]|uniref:DUF4191 domain-containing protein n=1 Tax=Nitriliruptor alkaliphilus TaxID=427918 RepID=UPI000696814D|nr:DUF4191 domain-containing protein [Nitriliruptor alkaliphilus]